jgi:hypothetical protein
MTRLLLAVAVGLFVLSLPLTKTKFGGQLRAAAGVCFALALIPALIADLFSQSGPIAPGHAHLGGFGDPGADPGG